MQPGCRTAINDAGMACSGTAQIRAVDHMVPHISTMQANKGERVLILEDNDKKPSA
jgi:hypothetical protein